MKASIKFREEQKPITRAKIPLTILGFPFQSGVVSGTPKELSLTLATFFESGPSVKLSYRPNDRFNPFSLVFKTGTGRYGSPNQSPINMSAELNLTTGSHNPRFFVHFKPRFGDFAVKKSQSSDFVKGSSNGGGLGSGSDDDSIEMVAPLTHEDGFHQTMSQETVTRALSGLLRGMEGSAKTSLPVMRRAVVGFRWGLKFPTENGTIITKMPLLVMNKISIEHAVTTEDNIDNNKKGSDEKDVDTWRDVKRKVEMIECENSVLRKGLDELRCEVSSGKFVYLGGVGGGERVGRGVGGVGEKKLKEERDGKEVLKKGV